MTKKRITQLATDAEDMSSRDNLQKPSDDSFNAALEKLETTRQRQQQKRIEAAARPGETWAQVAARLMEEDEQGKASSAMRKPPKGDGQADMFVPALYDVGTRDSRSVMDVAVFRLSKREKRAGEVIRYDLPDGYVEVKAGPDGMASIWDYDIVLMLISHLTEAMNRYREGKGDKPSRAFRPHISEILKFCRKGDGGRQVNEVEDALDRLRGTTIKSVRERPAAGGKRNLREIKTEGLIGDYTVVSYTDTGKIAAVEIEVPKWLHREITEGKRPDVLTVHPDYFLIDPGIGRFVYRLARRAAGKGEARWSFQTIYERSGSTGTFKKFSFTLRKIIKANDLPEYLLDEEAGQIGPILVMRHKDSVNKLPDGS